MAFIFFIEFSIELAIRKQCKPWSDAALYGVRFGSALFDYVPQKGHQAYIGKEPFQFDRHYYPLSANQDYSRRHILRHLSKFEEKKAWYFMRIVC